MLRASLAEATCDGRSTLHITLNTPFACWYLQGVYWSKAEWNEILEDNLIRPVYAFRWDIFFGKKKKEKGRRMNKHVEFASCSGFSLSEPVQYIFCVLLKGIGWYTGASLRSWEGHHRLLAAPLAWNSSNTALQKNRPSSVNSSGRLRSSCHLCLTRCPCPDAQVAQPFSCPSC